MESISQIRQMMAEQKFFEAQKLIEVQLLLQDKSHRHELLLLFSDALEAQQKSIPIPFLIELAECESLKLKHDFVLELIGRINEDHSTRYFQQIMKFKARAADHKGRINELYRLMEEFLYHQYAQQTPFIPDWSAGFIEKYFKHDFKIRLQMLGLSLLQNDLNTSEVLTKELILSCVEKSSPKGVIAKLQSIGEVLKSSSGKSKLEIYRSFCVLFGKGITGKEDYKKLTEMVIFFDEFKFQVMLLDLLVHLDLTSEATQYAIAIKENEAYDFVYFDKFFSHLKPFFFKREEEAPESKEKIESPDLSLESAYSSDIFSSSQEFEKEDDEQNFLHLLKHQSYSVDQLCDLSVSFLQSEMPLVALKAAEKAITIARNDHEYLKGSYLKLTSLLQLKDYRAGMDVCLEALKKAKTPDDILSFMYGQAEIYIRLNETKYAKVILSKIIAIDAKYRLAKERLDKLNEI